MTHSSQPLRIGILGAANIARAFCAAVKPSKLVEVAAVASRDTGKAAAFAAECGIPRSFGSYEALLADRDIDAIYNPLPNSLHAEWSIKAVQAKKPVLCEKPLAASAAEAAAMFKAARDNGVVLVEAYPYLAQPQSITVRDLVAEGAIGQLRVIRASFGFPLADAPNIRLDAALAGGALMDAGSYPVSLVLTLARERPARVQATARWDKLGVDRTIAATLDFDSGLIAQIGASFSTAYNRSAQIVGDRGTIETTYLNHPPIGGAPVVHLRRGPTVATEVEAITVAAGNGFLAEAEQFARLLADGSAQWTGASPEASTDIAATLEAVLASARTGATVAVAKRG